MRYRCTYAGGEYVESIFEVKSKTATAITLTMVEQGRYANYPSKKVRRIPMDGVRGDRFSRSAEHWGDGSFIVYHNQNGMPYMYEPISENRALPDLFPAT